MGKLGLNSGYIGSVQRITTNGVVGYDKYYLERKAGRFLTSYAGLLNSFPGAVVSYSLRLLSNTWNGAAIRVRRSSDNTEQDIGFVEGNLDTTTLLNFTGTSAVNNGFVTTWYDQSGNGYNAVQPTAINQPLIVTSGSISYSGAKPTIVTTSNQRTLTATPLRSDSNGAASWFITYELNTLLRQGVVSWGDSLDTGINFEPGANNTGVLIHKYAAFAYGPDSSDWWSTDQDLFSWISPGGLVESSNLYLNSNLATSGFNFGSNANINFSSTLRIGAGSSASTSGLTSNISEIILYNLDQSSNRTAIETNTNDFYSIY